MLHARLVVRICILVLPTAVVKLYIMAAEYIFIHFGCKYYSSATPLRRRCCVEYFQLSPSEALNSRVCLLKSRRQSSRVVGYLTALWINPYGIAAATTHRRRICAILCGKHAGAFLSRSRKRTCAVCRAWTFNFSAKHSEDLTACVRLFCGSVGICSRRVRQSADCRFFQCALVNLSKFFKDEMGEPSIKIFFFNAGKKV